MSIQSNFPAIKPSLLLDFASTKQLDNRVTFTRSTPAVYYDGKTTAMAEQNLILQSQTLDVNPWTGESVTANTATAPDGTVTAETYNQGGGTTYHERYQSMVLTTGQTYTVSVYAKDVDGTYLNMTMYSAANVYAAAIFNISTGAVTTTGAVGWTLVSSNITSVGNSWYRCSITFIVTTIVILPTLSLVVPNTTTIGDYGLTGVFTGASKQIYLWGAQLEQRSTATAYTPTTTQAITNYIPVLLTAGGNQPRFDCNPTTGESLGLLIEEQRTNLLTYSSDLSNAAWIKTNATVTSNTIVAPDGTLTGDKLVDDTTYGNHSALQGSITFANATSYTITIYAKAGEIGYIKIGRATGTALPSLPTAYFNLITATVLGSPNANWTNYSITDVGNGWRRCSVTVLTTGSGLDGIAIFLTDSSGNTGFTGNNYNGAYIWGAQVEQASFATSYIATTSASATRTADAASMTGTNFSSWYNNAEWTLYTETTFTNLVSSVVVSIDDNSFNNIARIGSYLNTLFTNVYSNSAFQFNQTPVSSLTRDVFYKIGFAAKPNSYAAIANTNTLIDQNSGILFTGAPFQMTIGNFFNGDPFTGRIKKIAYYPLRVTNTQLQALTS